MILPLIQPIISSKDFTIFKQFSHSLVKSPIQVCENILIWEWSVSGCIYDVCVCTHVHACVHVHTSSVTPFVFPLLYSCLYSQYAVVVILYALVTYYP